MSRPLPETPFARSLLAGLAEAQKRLEPKFFYDDRGSALFEQITELDAYYPTRTEIGILNAAAADIARRLGPGVVLVEPGGGALQKVGILIDALERPAVFAPGDISIAHLEAAAADIAARFPGLRVAPFKLDFDQPFTLPPAARAAGPVAVFFPGSTVGNFDPDGAIGLLRRFRAIEGAAHLLIGVDLKKEPGRLVRAYDDPEGVTAAFNLNLLARANRELGADFDLEAFRHKAVYDAVQGRIEMHLESLKAQTVTVLGRAFAFRPGETIHTENSYKYAVHEFQALAATAGWRAVEVWTDAENLFSVQLFAAD